MIKSKQIPLQTKQTIADDPSTSNVHQLTELNTQSSAFPVSARVLHSYVQITSKNHPNDQISISISETSLLIVIRMNRTCTAP